MRSDLSLFPEAYSLRAIKVCALVVVFLSCVSEKIIALCLEAILECRRQACRTFAVVVALY